MRPSSNFAALLIAVTLNAGSVAAKDKYTLEESVTDSRVFRVSQTMRLTGTLNAPRPKQKPLSLKMNAAASHAFLERRLPGRGRDAKALRVLREYRIAKTDTAVGSSNRTKQLSRELRRVVVQGDDTGLVAWSPKGSLSVSDVELLQMPGDALAARALLPSLAVAVKETWTPNSWALELVTGLDAAAKSDVTCRLESVKGNIAVISIAGKLEGARDGAPTKLELSGSLTFDLKRSFVTAFQLKQSEKSEPGPVSPALDVVANIHVRRDVSSDAGALTDKLVKAIPLDPKSRQLGVVYSPSLDAKFLLPRNWHVVYDNRELAILRLLDRGNLIAQVNIKPLKKAEAGKHVDPRDFQAEIRRSLGPQLTSLVSADKVAAKGTGDKRFLYRVVADGSQDGKEMRWIYALCAAPDGRQISLVFAVERKLIKPFGERDVDFLLGVAFPPASK